jgi:hypothetical protein
MTLEMASEAFIATLVGGNFLIRAPSMTRCWSGAALLLGLGLGHQLLPEDLE